MQIAISADQRGATFLHGLWRIEAKSSPFSFPSYYSSGTLYVKSRLEPELSVLRIRASLVTWNKDFFFFYYRH